jgi:hypothetical protein
VKSHADVHALRLKLKRLKSESHDVEGRREENEVISRCAQENAARTGRRGGLIRMNSNSEKMD